MREISNWFGLSERSPDADIVVLGCPFDEPASIRQGAAAAPAAIRRWSTTAQAVTEDGTEVRLRVHDCGDVAAGSDSPQVRWEAIEAAATTALAANPTGFLLGLGGDHAVTPPLVAAARVKMGAAADPLAVLRETQYRRRKTEERA